MTVPHALAAADCARCPLLPKRNPVLGAGPLNAALVVVGEGPGYHEDVRRTPFVGPSGLLLDETLAAAGLPREAVFVTNTIACRSTDAAGDDAPPPHDAVACCRPRLLAELNAVRPALILSVGGSAAKALLRTKQGINEIQGVVEHPADLPAPVLPTFHPAAVLHAGADGEDVFEDLFAATKRAVKIATGKMTVPPRDETIPWQHVQDAGHAERVLIDLLAGKAGYTLAIDVETDGLDVIGRPLLQVAVGNVHKAAVFEADVLTQGDCRVLLRRLLDDPGFTWLIHNSSFDLQWLREHFDTAPANVVDTLCLALGTTEHGNRVGLKRLAREWLNVPYYEAEVHAYLPSKDASWTLVPRPILAKYAARDVVNTARMFPILDDLCREEGTTRLVYDLLMPAQRTFAEVERHGVLIDQGYLASLEAAWQPRIDEAERAVQAYARARGWSRTVEAPRKEKLVHEWVEVKERTLKNGTVKRTEKPRRRTEYRTVYVDQPLNPRSPTQLQEFLYDHLKLRPPGGERTAGKGFRDAHPDHEVTKLLEDFGLADHMMRSYVRGIGRHVRADGRVHPNFKIFGAKTGRLSMGDPAIQTIPANTLLEDEGTGARRFDSIKRMFVPSEGHVWGETDFAALELRVAWALSGDVGLGEAIMSGDFHRAMASKIFRKPPQLVTKEERRDAKRVVFGIMYGRQAPAIAEQLGCAIETAQGYIDDFFAAAPRYAAWYREQHRLALETGRSITPFGRVRRWNLITRHNRQHVLNQSVNFPIQSVGTDLTLSALIKLQPLLKERGLGHVLFPVHDSIEYEVREGREAEAAALVRGVMTVWPFDAGDAVLDVETSFGPTWGDVKSWNS